MSRLALIQRSILIEAPAPAVYAFWRTEGLTRAFLVADERPAPLPASRLETDDKNRCLAWSLKTGPTREAQMTFAPLEGNATWLVFTAQWEAPNGMVDIADAIADLTRQVDSGLRVARDLIESRVAEVDGRG